MFNKVLIAEDLDIINEGIATLAKQLAIPETAHVQYCEDAVLKLKKAAQDGKPYDALITDLSFKTDYRKDQYSSGENLISEAKKLQPNLKVIVFSVEDRHQLIHQLITKQGIDAYVCKGRNGMQDLEAAVRTTATGNFYISPEVATAIQHQEELDIDELDLTILNELAKGNTQDQISNLFKKKNLKPNSLSTIEKRINKMKIVLKANNTIHLIAIVKDLGLV